MTTQENECIRFEKQVDGCMVTCTVELCEDGSVYVSSDEFEMIIEFTDHALEKAIAHVTAKGYVRVSE